MRKELIGDEIKQRKLDFSECKYVGEIHEIIREEFELPDWYGRNLDALWDSVTGIMYTPAEITVSRTAKTSELQNVVAQVIEILLEAVAEYDEIIVHVID